SLHRVRLEEARAVADAELVLGTAARVEHVEHQGIALEVAPPNVDGIGDDVLGALEDGHRPGASPLDAGELAVFAAAGAAATPGVRHVRGAGGIGLVQDDAGGAAAAAARSTRARGPTGAAGATATARRSGVAASAAAARGWAATEAVVAAVVRTDGPAVIVARAADVADGDAAGLDALIGARGGG